MAFISYFSVILSIFLLSRVSLCQQHEGHTLEYMVRSVLCSTCHDAYALLGTSRTCPVAHERWNTASHFRGLPGRLSNQTTCHVRPKPLRYRDTRFVETDPGS